MRIIHLTIQLIAVTVISSLAQSISDSKHLLQQSNNNFFIENKGQWPNDVLYLARTGGMNAWITKQGITYDYYKIEHNYSLGETQQLVPHKKAEFERNNSTIYGHVIKMNLVEANVNPNSSGSNKQKGYHNYFIGNDEGKWASYVALFGDIEIKEVYEGIGIRYYFDNGYLRYNYQIEPGSDIGQIKITTEGQDEIRINNKGELIIETILGEVIHGKLFAYQEENAVKNKVPCSFVMNEAGKIGIKTGNYDAGEELIIDPLVYSTFIGGSHNDYGWSLTIDAYGNTFITGDNYLGDFPTTTGAYQTSFSGNSDGFITKLNPSGTDLVYSTYIGGIGWDICQSIVIDSEGNSYITGYAGLGFPTTPGVFQPSFGGGVHDAFITKLNPSGTDLVYSTYLGGVNWDRGYSIVVDPEGNSYIAGFAGLGFPITPGAYQINYGGDFDDAFITKLNPSGTDLVYSTFLGGNDTESISSIDIDSYGNTYVTGSAGSADFPTTPGAYQTNSGGGVDAFITKLNSTGSDLVYSTFLSGYGGSGGSSLVIDSEGNAYITGSAGEGFPITPGAFQSSYGGPFEGFISKLNPSGSDLVFSTYLGGITNGEDICKSIAVDSMRNSFITGYTNSSDFPTTPGAYQTTFGGDFDVFITKLNPTGSFLAYSTYLGGEEYSRGNSIVVDTEGNCYIAGYAGSSFPTTPGAYQTNSGGLNDLFIIKLSILDTVTINYINVLTPNGGEEWIANTEQSIIWNRNRVDSVHIEYTTNNGASWMTVVSSLPAAAGTYLWTIPNAPSIQCRVKITDVSDSTTFDISDAVFTIYNVSGIGEDDVPDSYALFDNFPNPFNPTTKIKYSIPEETDVVLKLYNSIGEEIITLVKERQQIGYYTVTIDATDLPSGIYFYRLHAGSFVEAKKMVLMK